MPYTALILKYATFKCRPRGIVCGELSETMCLRAEEQKRNEAACILCSLAISPSSPSFPDVRPTLARFALALGFVTKLLPSTSSTSVGPSKFFTSCRRLLSRLDHLAAAAALVYPPGPSESPLLHDTVCPLVAERLRHTLVFNTAVFTRIMRPSGFILTPRATRRLRTPCLVYG